MLEGDYELALDYEIKEKYGNSQQMTDADRIPIFISKDHTKETKDAISHYLTGEQKGIWVLPVRESTMSDLMTNAEKSKKNPMSSQGQDNVSTTNSTAASCDKLPVSTNNLDVIIRRLPV